MRGKLATVVAAPDFATARRPTRRGSIRATPSICPGIAPAVDQQVLAGDEAGMLRAQERAIGPELGRPPVAPGRIGLGPRAPELVEALAGLLEQAAHVLALGAAVEDAGEQVVDGHVAPDGLPREAADEADEAGARAVRQPELELRDLHAARHDVEDAAEAA